MSLLVVVIFGVANVLAQIVHSTSAFNYQGCSSVNVSCFSSPIVFSDVRLTPEACQAACLDHHFAALFPDACRCGDDASAVTPVDESVCDHPCMGNPALGSCGSVCPREGPDIANVYGRTGPLRQGPESATGRPVNTMTPVPAPVTSCSTAKQPTTANPSTPTLMTPCSSAPGTPTSSTTVAPEVTPSFPQSQTGPSLTTCSPKNEYSASTVSTHPTLASQPSGNEPPAYEVPGTSSPVITAGPSPPEYSSDVQLTPLPVTSAVPDFPDNSRSEGPPTGTNCSTSGSSDPPTDTPKSTMSIRPSDKFPKGTPPVPVQVPGSDSHRLIPPFCGVGGLALVAMMMV